MSANASSNPRPSHSSTDEDSPYTLSLAHHRRSTTVSPIYGFLLRSLIPQHSTTRGTSISHLTLAPEHLNSAGSIHGSVSATIVDWASGNALATMGSGSGASVDMHVTFLNKAKLGEVVEVRGIVDKLGRRMAFTRVEVKRVSDGELVVTAIHTKIVG
ncbi:hypothetical protein NliqN6_5503 [Naganishia liquefaciens]|uniref:Thioesterase domain-containing protein n=1 Tax=Naganishia liquefaciens TaxID=104408 RepID=A0A8H3TWX3_9TREE|nr:hypothetical protein NliqN6_5503 [Naganishia liquefaciens]